MPTFTLPDASAYLVAFSGGADSRLLLELTLRALLERHGEEGRSRVAAAHLHHGIRGAEADRDLDFCRDVCDGLGIELIAARADIPAMAAEDGESLETAARRARYAFFARVTAERGIPVLLTAHHADDNLETVLDRLLRGSGLRGMGGIPPSRPLNDAAGSPTVHRPLLEWTKRDVLEACRRMELAFITDSTNLETDHTRNRLRHTVLPALEEIAGAGIPQRAAARLSRTAREDESCLWGLAEAALEAHVSEIGDGLPLAVLQSQYPSISKRMMAILYERRTAETHPRDESSTLSAAHLEALCRLIGKGIPESAVTLPRGAEARIRGEWLYIRPAEAFAESPAPGPVSLETGRTPFGPNVTVEVEDSSVTLPPREGPTVYASAVFPITLPLPLIARPRETGDTILSHGMHKKIKKLLCDKNIPPHLRDRIPLICLPGGEPLWFPSVAFRDGFPAPCQGPCRRITVFVETKLTDL